MIAPRQRHVALLVAACFFMQNLDGTIVTTAAKRIGIALRVSSLEISLIITAYLITFAVLIPLGGWLVSRVGTRRVFLVSILVFTLASLACACSVNFWMLVAMRILQGAGGAMMTPTGRIVALANVEKTDMLRIMSFIVWPGLIAPVLAPLVGGLITTYASWRWLFLINLPLGFIAFGVGLRLMPNAAVPPSRRLDGAGVALTAVGLGGLTYTAHLLSVSTPGWVSATFGAVSLAFIAVAITHLLRAEIPLLNLRVFKISSFSQANGGMSLFMLVVGAVPFLLPLLFETVFDWSAVRAGSVVLVVFVGNIGIKPATTWLYNTFGFRNVLVVATAGVTASMAVLALFRSSTPIVVMVAVLLVHGAFRSTGFTGYMSLAYSDIPETEMRDANVLASTVQQVGAGLAVAAGAVALNVGGAITVALKPHPMAVSAYAVSFLLLGVIGLATLVLALRMPADAGASVRSTTTRRGVETPAEPAPEPVG